MTRTAATPARPVPAPVTVAELLKRLGDIPPERIRLVPPPGTATERDVLALLDHENRLYELVEGTLVEKAIGFAESVFTGILIGYVGGFVLRHNLGIAAGPDGVLKLTTGLVRIPDLSFVSWDRLPGRKPPTAPIPKLPLDLAVEVLSKGNTKAEMARKLTEYFDAGTTLVWIIDPRKRTIHVHTAPGQVTIPREGDTLDGGDVLPGFALPLKTLFDQASRGPNP